MNYKELPAHSRVWIYQSSRPLTKEEVEQVQQAGKSFIANWATHGASLKASFEVFQDRFVVIFADEAQVKASGCSIDASVRLIKQLEGQLQLDLFDRTTIAFLQNGEILTLPMSQFQRQLKEGILNAETLVYNNLVDTKQAFEEKWLIPVKDSWHKQLL
jgi:hypothetical protein